MTVRSLGDVLLVLWALPAILSPLVYLGVQDWRHTPLGRHLMSYMAALAFLALLGLIRLVFDDGPLWAGLRTVGFVALILVSWWRLIVVAQAFVEYRRGRAVAERRASRAP